MITMRLISGSGMMKTPLLTLAVLILTMLQQLVMEMR